MITTFLFVVQMTCSQHEAMNHRGETAMGFSQHATKHTFRLLADGGTIEVRANDPKDAKSVEAIRAHLREIAKSFAAGNFAKPQFIHDRLPDGAEEMKELRKTISYRYENLPKGGRVRISTRERKAIDAVHRFLRFQIEEHGAPSS